VAGVVRLHVRALAAASFKFSLNLKNQATFSSLFK
jgi:hypothetical protein